MILYSWNFWACHLAEGCSSKAAEELECGRFRRGAPSGAPSQVLYSCHREPTLVGEGSGRLLKKSKKQRPARVFRNYLVFIAAQFFEYGQKARFVAVAERDGDISPQAGETRALHRRTAEDSAKLFQAQARQPLQIGIHQPRPRLKLPRLRQRGFTVPRANVLTDIAAEHLPAHAGTQLFGNRAAFLDGEIRDAPGRVQLIRSREGIGRAGVEAARARAAAVGRWQIGCQYQRRQHDAEKEPRPQVLIQNAGVLANPADPCVLGKDPLNDRARVHVTPGARRGHLLLLADSQQPRFQREELPEYHLVIVVLRPSVARDPSLCGRAGVRRVRLARVVIQGAYHHRTRPRCDVRQRRALQFAGLVARFQVLHLTRTAVGNPLGKKVVLRGVGYSGYAGEVEACLGGKAFDVVGDHGQGKSAGHAVTIIGGVNWPLTTDNWQLPSDSQLLHFFVVVLAVEDVPFLRTFQDGAALAFDLLPGGSVNPGFLGHQQFQNAARFQADTIAVLEEVHVVHLGEGVGHSVRQLVDLFAAEPHSTALYFRTSSFLIFLNISW